MPHDKNGTPLSVGDVVLLRAKVTDICQSESGCNVSLSIETTDTYQPHMTMNSVGCEKFNPEHEKLVKADLDKLAALESSGVDNWPGYDDAMQLLREWEAEEKKELV